MCCKHNDKNNQIHTTKNTYNLKLLLKAKGEKKISFELPLK